ncbi:hypothetical protein PV392_24070, partial [Streptomyces sp. ME03-5709C]|nr:hypothetical protein [Streptomyces sp. ME03-5709C]
MTDGTPWGDGGWGAQHGTGGGTGGGGFGPPPPPYQAPPWYPPHPGRPPHLGRPAPPPRRRGPLPIVAGL